MKNVKCNIFNFLQTILSKDNGLCNILMDCDLHLHYNFLKHCLVNVFHKYIHMPCKCLCESQNKHDFAIPWFYIACKVTIYNYTHNTRMDLSCFLLHGYQIPRMKINIYMHIVVPANA
jgi:hypothetical protein